VQRQWADPGRVLGRALQRAALGVLLLSVTHTGRGGALVTYTTHDGFEGGGVGPIAEAPNGNIWVGAAAGVFEFDGQWIAHAEAGGPEHDSIYGLDVDRAGNLWAANGKGVYRWDSARWQLYKEVRLGSARLRAQTGLRCAPNGEVWVTGADRRIYRFRAGTWHSYGLEAGLPDDYGTSVACDQRSYPWVTFELGDVARFDGQSWRVWTSTERPWNRSRWGGTVYATSIAVDRRTNVWVGTWDGVFVFDGEQWRENSPRVLSEAEELCIQSVATDPGGRVWVGSFSQGVFYFDGDRWRHLSRENYALPGDFVITVFADSRDHLWVSDRGARVHRLAFGEEATALTRQNARESALRVVRTGTGDLWVATGYSWVSSYLYGGAELRRYRANGALEIFTAGVSNLLTKEVRDLKLGPDGTLWVATACGLFRWDQTEFVPCSVRAGKELAFSGCAYRADPTDQGRKEKWFLSPGKGEGWSELELPVWPKPDYGLVKRDSAGWYCVRFDVPRSCEGWDLLFLAGQANDEDEVYFNGSRIGSSSMQTRQDMADIIYVVPHTLVRAGAENLLHIRLRGTLQPATTLQKPRLTPIQRLTEAMDLTAMAVDREGRVWVSTRTGQFACYDGRSWAALLISMPEFAHERFSAPCLLVDQHGCFWVGSSNVLMALPRGAKRAVEPASLPEMRGGFPRLRSMRALGEDRSGALWFATDAGLGKWSDSTWSFAEWPFMPHKQMRVCLAFDSRGRVWVGSCCRELLAFNGQNWSAEASVGLPGQGISNLALDGERGLWIASRSGGLSYHHFDVAAPHVKLTAPPTQVSSAGKVMLSWEGWDQWQETLREDLRYIWRLDKGPWSEPQSTTIAFLDSLKPGPHQFAVKALDRDLNESEASLAAFSVAWPVWKQGWFLGLVGGLALLAVLSAAFALSRHQRLKAACADLGTSTVALEKANAKLRELDELKTQFLSNVSHELRTPLTSIKGSADNLLDGIVGELSRPQREYVELIRTGTHRLIPFVEDLLDLSRIENDRMELVRQPIQVDRLLEQTVKGLQSLASEQQITLRLEQRGTQLTVQVDADRISQVITNLVENALRYTPAGGTVTIAAEQADSAYARILVTDTGSGIPEGEQGRIFEKFYQVQGQALPRHHGAGLGLSIAKGIVEAHAGSIGVKNNPDGGSVFWFTLPLVADAATTLGRKPS
jgi:signal transduction histidine kinase/ligand-binding sensor domain-containing protein